MSQKRERKTEGGRRKPPSYLLIKTAYLSHGTYRCKHLGLKGEGRIALNYCKALPRSPNFARRPHEDKRNGSNADKQIE